VSFASDPGWDDGGLPPANAAIPDDARELDRDVLAYRRELRAQRRRELLTRILRPSRWRGGGHRGGDRGGGDRGGHSPILPLIVTCVALAMLAGAMLSVVTISPAAAPTVPSRANATATAAASLPVGLTMLPSGTVRLDGRTEPVRGMTSAVLALVPGGCGCAPALRRLASQAVNARVGLYFVGEGPTIPRLPALTAQDGDGAAVAVSDNKNVLGSVYRPAGLTVLLVYSDATAQVRRDLGSDFQLGPMMHALSLPGKEAAS
jgi:hypothetical protein